MKQWPVKALFGKLLKVNHIFIMKRRIILCAAVLMAAVANTFACTNLIVGKNASADGSTIVSYSADSYGLFGELYHYPAATYPKGTMLKVYEWDTGKYLGEIEQARQTYNVVGNMNEYQVTIGETTFGGRPELADSTGIIDYGSLIYIGLQRSRTAREAIKIMTDLVQQYGYYSEGESFTIADPNEIWIMEMIGKGPGIRGAVWVAVRVPDDCISAHANQSRIHQFDMNDKENCMYSPDVVSFAREKGYFNGVNKDFSFSLAYAPLDFGARRFCEARVWSYFNKFTDNGKDYLPYIEGKTNTPMPLFVKPKHKLSVQDVKDMMRDHYEGTPLDISNDFGAGPYKTPYRLSPLNFKVDGQEYFNERPISTQQSGFVFVAQMRAHKPDPIGGVLWFGVDDANMAVFTPVYCCATKVPDVISCNLYPRWYVDKPVRDYLNEVYDWIVEDGNGKGKPFIVSEIGAGGLYGCHNAYHGKWTEEYQADALSEQVSECLKFSESMGVYIWQFCDVRVSSEWFAGRPREMNNKGVVDEYRRPKAAYGRVKEIFEQYTNYYEE